MSKTTTPKKSASKAIPKSTRFEDALGELETIVQTLEEGDQSLEESLVQFERGVSLARFCQQSLGDAEKKISILIDADSKASAADGKVLQDFDPDENSDTA